jgi:hypothetical protein
MSTTKIPLKKMAQAKARAVKPPPSLEARLDQLAELRQRLSELVPAEAHDVQKEITALEADIKTECINQQRPAEGQFLKVVLAEGRTSWHTKELEAYLLAKDLKEIVQQFKTVGDPTARIVEVKKD